jgi:hypothetical protein
VKKWILTAWKGRIPKGEASRGKEQGRRATPASNTHIPYDQPIPTLASAAKLSFDLTPFTPTPGGKPYCIFAKE